MSADTFLSAVGRAETQGLRAASLLPCPLARQVLARCQASREAVIKEGKAILQGSERSLFLDLVGAN